MFQRFEIERVLRSENRPVNALSKLASPSPNGCPKNIHLEILLEWTIDAKELVWINRSKIWMEPLTSYLRDKTLLQDPKEADRIKKRSEWFLL